MADKKNEKIEIKSEDNRNIKVSGVGLWITFILLWIILVLIIVTMASPLQNTTCFHDWEISFICGKQNAHLEPKIIFGTAGETKYWFCANSTMTLWTVKAC